MRRLLFLFVALGEELGGDAEGDFVRVVRAEIEADGTVKLRGALGREAFGDEFLAKDGGFRCAADAAEVRKISRGERAVENRAVGLVALRHAEDEGVGGERVDGDGEIVKALGAEVPRVGKFREPLGSRVEDGNRAREREQDGKQRLRDVAGAENRDGPRGAAGGVRLEIKFHGAAAGHADVALERPACEARARAVGAGGGEKFERERERLGLDAAAADGAGMQAGGGDEHFRAGVLRRAAERLDEHDEHERRAGALERGELFVKSGGVGGGFGHRARIFLGEV